MKIIGAVLFTVVASHAGVAVLHRHHHQLAALHHQPVTASAAVSYPGCTEPVFSRVIPSRAFIREIAY